MYISSLRIVGADIDAHYYLPDYIETKVNFL